MPAGQSLGHSLSNSSSSFCSSSSTGSQPLRAEILVHGQLPHCRIGLHKQQYTASSTRATAQQNTTRDNRVKKISFKWKALSVRTLSQPKPRKHLQFHVAEMCDTTRMIPYHRFVPIAEVARCFCSKKMSSFDVGCFSSSRLAVGTMEANVLRLGLVYHTRIA